MEISGLVYLIIIVTIIDLPYGKANNYCKIKCLKGGVHTACKYGSLKPNCGNKVVVSYGLTKQEKQDILKEHNDFRQKVARGLETRGNPGPQPPAKNMKNLVWNDELAYVAQVWANQCQYGHDTCRDVAKYQVGQNVALTGSTAAKYENPVNLVKMWENEVKDYNPKKKFSENNFIKIGHYTQMVWANTKEIGCGSMKYTENKWHYHYLVCNYGPSGNFGNEELYQTK
uniref:Venom allergen 5 n=1 Tax=Vespula maculifrons TaxID=7453 RepID=VAL5_VESMC|nr:RecName: Full=Venom allergen 5; AltName: Full=Antigen 5; AltName: Full=Cysteine-rich venom protein; Short=CRVP; Flags: Precursor [Vespula maculifrons]ABC73068.1 venom allergen 5 [Vespula maculifrons]